MSESPYIHNVGMQNFQAMVLENSMKQPVLVDFWADWCQPCLTLMPMLAALADEYAGKFILAKVNSDEEQELAAHFGIKSLPTMKLFVQGQLVDERSGVIPESEIRAFIDKHLSSPGEDLMQTALIAMQQGDNEQAMQIMNQALAADPENSNLKVQVAELVYAQGDADSALALLDSLKMEDRQIDAAVKLRAQINMDQQLAGLEDPAVIEQRLEKNPDDLEALQQKSLLLTAKGEHEAAMECLLKIMLLDRSFGDDAGRKGLIALFDLLGGEHAGVQKYRRKLFTMLH